MVLLRRIAGLLSTILKNVTPLMIIIVVLVERLNVAFLLSRPVEGTIVIYGSTMLKFIKICISVFSIGLAMMDSMVRLIHVNIEVLRVLTRMVTVHVTSLAAMERVVRHFVHGLLNNKIDRLVALVMVIISVALVLVDNIGAAMLTSERNLLNNDLVMLIHAVNVTKITMVFTIVFTMELVIARVMI